MIFIVYFEKDVAGYFIRYIEFEDKEVIEEELVKIAEESMYEIVDVQKCVLDQWCFVEYYESYVFLQVNSCLIYEMYFMVFMVV